MTPRRRLAPASFSLFAAFAAIGCGAGDVLSPPSSNEPPSRAPDDVPPSHTGGLDIAVSDANGNQGPGADPASHGDPVAAAIATGIGVGVLGAGAAATVANCAEPGSDPRCLRGKGPFETPSASASAPAGPAPAAAPLPTMLPGTCLHDEDCAAGATCEHENALGPKPKREPYSGAYCSTKADVCNPDNDAETCGKDAACVYSHSGKRWSCLTGALRRASD